MAAPNYNFQKFVDAFNDLSAYNADNLRGTSDEIARRMINLINNVVGDTPPDPPSGVTATGGALKVDLAWDAQPEADSFAVYGSDTGTAGSFTELAGVLSNAYTEEGLVEDQTRYYYVVSIANFQRSEPSAIVSGTATAGAGVADPDAIGTFQFDSTGYLGAEMSWDNFTGTTILCRIERSQNEIDWQVIANEPGSNYFDGDVTQGDTYYYRAYGVNEEGDLSAASSTISFTVPTNDTTAPPIPGTPTATPGDGSVYLEWSGVAASDLAGYQIGYDPTPTGGTYTVFSVGGVDTTQRRDITIPGLTNGTEYGFAVCSIDTSGNTSDWSGEVTATPADVGGDVTPPDPPTGLVASSPEAGTVVLNWDPNTEPDLDIYRVYRRVLGSGDLFVDVSGAGVSGALNTFTDTGLDPSTTYAYRIKALDVTGNESSFSDGVAETADGNDGTGGEPGNPGQGSIDGDTGLGPNHRAPGYTFDYVIDVSDGTLYSGNAIAQGLSRLKERFSLPTTNSLYIDRTADYNIGILLPTRVDRGSVHINENQSGANAATVDLPLSGSRFNVHLIGPWCTDTFGDTKTAAMVKVRDDDAGNSFGYKIINNASDGAAAYHGGNTIGGNLTQKGFNGSVHFWCIEVEGAGRSVASFGTSPGTNYSDFPSGLVDIHFHLTKIHQTNIRPLFTSSQNKWCMSSWLVRMHMHGLYTDVPWAQEHHFYFREPAYGDMTFEYVRGVRAGGQFFQLADRATGTGQGYSTSVTQKNGLTDPGTVYYRGLRGVLKTGRSMVRASSFLTHFSNHQSIDMQDCYLAEIDPYDSRCGWPPPNPYSDQINDVFLKVTWAGTSFESSAASQEPQGWQTDSAPYPGYFIGKIYMRDCVLYSKQPAKDIFSIPAAAEVDIEDCGFFTGPATTVFQNCPDGGQYAPGSRSTITFCAASTHPRDFLRPDVPCIGPFRWVSNNQASHSTILQGGEFNIDPGDIVDPAVLLGDNKVNVGNGSNDITWDEFVGRNYSAGVDPVNLVIA